MPVVTKVSHGPYGRPLNCAKQVEIAQMGLSRSEVHIVRDDAFQFRAGHSEPTEDERRFERTRGWKTIGSTSLLGFYPHQE